MSSYIVGVNSAYHQLSVVLSRGKEVLFAVEEERLNRIKHGRKATVESAKLLPELSLELVKEYVNPEKIEAVVFSFNPVLRRLLAVSDADRGLDIPEGDFGTPKGEETFFKNLLFSIGRLRELFPEAKIFTIRHHLAHAFSAFATLPFATPENTAFLTVDGIGEVETLTAGIFRNGKILTLWKQFYPDSLGFLWEKITSFLGYKAMNDEPKIMALAAYGNPDRFRKAFRRFVRIENGLLKIDNKVLNFRGKSFSSLEKLLGKKLSKYPANREDENRQKDIAAALQEVTEEFFLQACKKLREETASSTLAIAGGVALNCVAVGKIAEAGIFDKIWIQPASHDGGTALGGILWYLWKKGKDFHFPMKTVFLSPEVKVDHTIFEKYPVKFEKILYPEEDAAEELKKGKVVGWFQGKMEFGPRALGGRSILANPLIPGIRNRLNRLKKREQFRPIACTVLKEFANEWFCIPEPALWSAENMNVAVKCREKTSRITPSVVHRNGTCRIQLLHKEPNLFRKLIERFHRLTGIPFVINTSLNIEEPIVFTPDDAIKTFLRGKEMDVLYIENFKITRGKL